MDLSLLVSLGIPACRLEASSSHGERKDAKTSIINTNAQSKKSIQKKSQAIDATSFVKEASPLSGLVDIDANFLHDDFQGDGVLDNLLKTAYNVGVAQFVTPAVTLEDCARAIQLANNHPTQIFVTTGVHPFWTAAEVGGTPREAGVDFSGIEFEKLRLLAQDNIVRGIGECGLDFVRAPTEKNGFPGPDSQMPWFEAQVKLACELQKPLFLHIRSAFVPAIEVLEKHRSNLPPAIVHAFTGTEEELEAFRKLDFFIGVTGYICQKTVALRDCLPKHVPLDRLMVETDAPYMGFKGCRSAEATKRQDKYPNVPAALPKVVQSVAECYQVSPEEVALITSANARSFFSM